MDFELDHEKRKDRVCCSELPALFGIDDFGRDQFSVYYNKKGGGEREPPSMRQRMGHFFEPAILNIYTEITGRAHVRHNRTILDPKRPYFAGTPDALCVDDPRVIEAKLVSPDQRHLFGETANEIQRRGYILQGWGYCGLLNLPRCDLIVLIGTDDPRIYTIERDMEAERAMFDYVERWHATYILGDAVPPLGRSPQAEAYLQAMYPTHKQPDLREADADEARMLNEYLHILLDERALKTHKSEIAIALKAAIKDREGLLWEEGRFTWRKSKDSEEIQWECMARGLLNEFIKDEEKRAELIGFYTNPKPGKRRIRMDHPALRKGGVKTEEEEEITA